MVREYTRRCNIHEVIGDPHARQLCDFFFNQQSKYNYDSSCDYKFWTINKQEN